MASAHWGRWKARLVQRIVPWTLYASPLVLQYGCLVHQFNTHVLEVRLSDGASMLPTLALYGDFLLHFRLPFLEKLRRLRSTVLPDQTEASSLPHQQQGYVGGSRFSKYDQSHGTGLRHGDLVVSLSPIDPHKNVCKRVVGLPGDTICIDPRLPPIPVSAWRGRGPQPQVPTDTNDQAAEPPVSKELLENSLDLTSPKDRDHQSHNEAASQMLPQTDSGKVRYITVPTGHVWLAGDNLANSTDSRHYGPVPLGLVRSKVVAVAYPHWQWLTDSLT